MPSNPSSHVSAHDSVHRALSQVGKGVYELGRGGRTPSSLNPFSTSKNPARGGRKYCDCSGFVSWSLGYDRVQGLGSPDEVWYSTTQMVDDALSANPRMFRKVGLREAVLEGDVLVYPAGNGRRYGHTGVITGVSPEFKRLEEGWWAHLEVTHCTTGYKAAVVTTNALLWAERGGYILRYLHQDRE